MDGLMLTCASISSESTILRLSLHRHHNGVWGGIEMNYVIFSIIMLASDTMLPRMAHAALLGISPRPMPRQLQLALRVQRSYTASRPSNPPIETEAKVQTPNSVAIPPRLGRMAQSRQIYCLHILPITYPTPLHSVSPCRHVRRRRRPEGFVVEMLLCFLRFGLRRLVRRSRVFRCYSLNVITMLLSTTQTPRNNVHFR
jgi:hypothetical protein